MASNGKTFDNVEYRTVECEDRGVYVPLEPRSIGENMAVQVRFVTRRGELSMPWRWDLLYWGYRVDTRIEYRRIL